MAQIAVGRTCRQHNKSLPNYIWYYRERQKHMLHGSTAGPFPGRRAPVICTSFSSLLLVLPAINRTTLFPLSILQPGGYTYSVRHVWTIMLLKISEYSKIHVRKKINLLSVRPWTACSHTLPVLIHQVESKTPQSLSPTASCPVPMARQAKHTGRLTQGTVLLSAEAAWNARTRFNRSLQDRSGLKSCVLQHAVT